jgi:hypothetical protein
VVAWYANVIIGCKIGPFSLNLLVGYHVGYVGPRLVCDKGMTRLASNRHDAFSGEHGTIVVRLM